MSSSDDTSFNQSTNEGVSLEVPATEEYTFSEISQQDIANSISSNIFDIDASKHLIDGLSMITIEANQWFEKLMTPMASISALVQEASALQISGLSSQILAIDSAINAFAMIAPIQPLLGIADQIAKSATFQLAPPPLNILDQIAKSATFQLTPLINDILSNNLLLGNFADMGISSMVNNLTVLACH